MLINPERLSRKLINPELINPELINLELINPTPQSSLLCYR